MAQDFTTTPITRHKTVTRDEWLAQRVDLLKAEKALTRQSNELSRQRQELPWPTFTKEGPGMSAFALEDGNIYHTYSAYARGLDGLWGIYQWLDRAPLGRNEKGLWMRRHDEYDRT